MLVFVYLYDMYLYISIARICIFIFHVFVYLYWIYVYTYISCICICILHVFVYLYWMVGLLDIWRKLQLAPPLASSHRITRDSDSTTPDYISCYFDILILIDKKSS